MRARQFLVQPVMPSRPARLDQFRDHYRSLTTSYEAAIHGSYNVTSGAPFYDAAHAAALFDVGNDGFGAQSVATAGDHEPSVAAMYVYDTVWLYAHSINELAARGVSPLDGAELLTSLRRADFAGLTGRVRLNNLTQDREVALGLYHAQPTGAPAAGFRRLAANATFDLARVDVEDIAWAAGYMPSDGSNADEGTSLVSWSGGERPVVGDINTLRLELRDSFDEVLADATAVDISILAYKKGSTDHDASLCRVVPMGGVNVSSAERVFQLELLQSGDMALEVLIKQGTVDRTCRVVRIELHATVQPVIVTALICASLSRAAARAAARAVRICLSANMCALLSRERHPVPCAVGFTLMILSAGPLMLRVCAKKSSREDSTDMTADESEAINAAAACGAKRIFAAAKDITRSALVLGAYFALGGLGYQFLQPEWTFAQVVYFCMVTCSTVSR